MVGRDRLDACMFTPAFANGGIYAVRNLALRSSEMFPGQLLAFALEGGHVTLFSLGVMDEYIYTWKSRWAFVCMCRIKINQQKRRPGMLYRLLASCI